MSNSLGPVRFTRMHRTENRREVQFIKNNLGIAQSKCEIWSFRELRYLPNYVPIILNGI